MKIVLINGESSLLINEEIDKLIGSSKNVISFDMLNNNIMDLFVEAGYSSMFLEDKYIVVRNATFFGSGKLNDKESEILLNYLANPNQYTNIIFVCNEKVDARKKITKVLKEKYTVISVPNLKPYEIESRVEKYLASYHYQIDKETLKYILTNSLNNYDLVMSEVEKIMLFYNKPSTIKKEDVQNIVAKVANTNNFLFVDALIDGNLEASLSILADLKIMKVEPTILLTLVARDIRIMLNIKNMLEQNKREYEILNALKLADWQLEKYLKKAFPYKKRELEEWLVKLADLDLKVKSGKLDRYYALELLILDICT